LLHSAKSNQELAEAIGGKEKGKKRGKVRKNRTLRYIKHLELIVR